MTSTTRAVTAALASRALPLRFPATLALAASLFFAAATQGQTTPPQTAVAGSATPSALSNRQSAFSLRHIVLLTGLYPTQPTSTGLTADGLGTIGELRFLLSSSPLHSSCPDANGQIVLVQSYPAAFSIMETRFGGNGTTTFRLPDLQRRLPVGRSTSGVFSTMGAASGADTFTLTVANLPAHDHTIATPVGSGAEIDNHQPSLALRYFINDLAEVRAATWANDVQGWLPADGRLLSTATYPNLFNLIGYTYGGSGATFALPDLRGRTPICAGTTSAGATFTIGETYGAPTLAVTSAAMPAHAHGLPGGGQTFTNGDGSVALDNRQPSLVLNAGVVYNGTYPSSNFALWQSSDAAVSEVRLFASNVLPAGVFPADGRTLSIATYQQLFALIGPRFGGNGVTTFALPNLAGYAFEGSQSGESAVYVPGSDTLAIGSANLPSHTHTLVAGPSAIPNPGFEADTFANWPGYAPGNGDRITGWNVGGLCGLNGRTFDPFTTGGQIPEGNQAAFLQSYAGGPASLLTRVYGLTTGARYQVRFRTNMRADYDLPAASWSINDSPLMPLLCTPFVAGPSPYYTITGAFTATGPTADLRVFNEAPGDNALLIDAFELIAEPASEPWRLRRWSGDTTANMSAATTHWAYRFGSGAAAPVNTAVFTPVPSLAPAVAGRFAATGFTQSLADVHSYAITPGSGSDTLASDVLLGTNATLALENLVVGVPYHLTLFLTTLSDLPKVTFASTQDLATLDVGAVGTQSGFRLDYSFVPKQTLETITLRSHDGQPPFQVAGVALCTPKPDVEVVDNAGLDFASLSFVEVPYGTTSPAQRVRVRNFGDAPLSIASAEISTPYFGVAPALTGTNVLPGEEATLDVHYSANQPGVFGDSLTFLTNDPDTPSLSYSLNGSTAYRLLFWSNVRFGPQAGNPAIAGPEADPDGDGLANRLEYATGTDPLTANRSPVRVSTAPGGREIRIHVDPFVADQRYAIQRSTNLTTWTPILQVSPSETYLEPGLLSAFDNDTSEAILLDPTAGPQLFWRLVVEEPTP